MNPSVCLFSILDIFYHLGVFHLLFHSVHALNSFHETLDITVYGILSLSWRAQLSIFRLFCVFLWMKLFFENAVRVNWNVFANGEVKSMFITMFYKWMGPQCSVKVVKKPNVQTMYLNNTHTQTPLHTASYLENPNFGGHQKNTHLKTFRNSPFA